MNGKNKFKPYLQNQPMLLPHDIRDLIEPESRVWLINEYVESLDLSEIETGYSHLGQNAYDPRMLLKVLLYGYAEGITSSRSMAQAVKTQVEFIYLAGFQRPDFRTINRFRKNNLAVIERLFQGFVRMMFEHGIITLRRVSIDSTIMKANASAWKAKDLSEWKKLSAAIEEEVRKYLQECEDTDRDEDRKLGDHDGFSLPEKLRKKSERKKAIDKAIREVEGRLRKEKGPKAKDDPRFSPTDPDARTIARHHRLSLGYNPQIAVDHGSGMVVAAIVPNTITDQTELLPDIKAIHENTGRLPDEVLADSGYASGEAFEGAENMGVDVYVREKPSGRKAKYFSKDRFTYNPSEDTFTCPEGKTLRRMSWQGRAHVVYRADVKDCEGCPVRERCFNTKNRIFRIIITDNHEPSRQRLRAKMATEESRQKYRERGRVVEPVIGQIKEAMGIKGFRLRGKDKVNGEWSLINLAYNLRRWHRLILAKPELKAVMSPAPG